MFAKEMLVKKNKQQKSTQMKTDYISLREMPVWVLKHVV
jgi:hypothetical protein